MLDNVTNRMKNHDTYESTTSEKYPSITLKGSIDIFLWFCLHHGHCYGFHIIDGSEGRKDSATSLISYLKVVPKVIFYNFPYSLEEYRFNRESGNTQFYHDIFHDFSHSCSPAYNSKLLSVLGVNTSFQKKDLFACSRHLSDICYYKDLFNSNDCIYFHKKKFVLRRITITIMSLIK